MRTSSIPFASRSLVRVLRAGAAVLVLVLQLAAVLHVHVDKGTATDDAHCAWCAVAHSPVVAAAPPPQPAPPLELATRDVVSAPTAPPDPAPALAPARAPPSR